MMRPVLLLHVSFGFLLLLSCSFNSALKVKGFCFFHARALKSRTIHVGNVRYGGYVGLRYAKARFI